MYQNIPINVRFITQISEVNSLWKLSIYWKMDLKKTFGILLTAHLFFAENNLWMNHQMVNYFESGSVWSVSVLFPWNFQLKENIFSSHPANHRLQVPFLFVCNAKNIFKTKNVLWFAALFNKVIIQITKRGQIVNNKNASNFRWL